MILKNIGLVLEGGSLRGLYSAGVLDIMMDNVDGFELAKKVADYHKLESKIEPTNRIHATRFPQEKLQMTIFIPQDKIAIK